MSCKFNANGVIKMCVLNFMTLVVCMYNFLLQSNTVLILHKWAQYIICILIFCNIAGHTFPIVWKYLEPGDVCLDQTGQSVDLPTQNMDG